MASMLALAAPVAAQAPPAPTPAPTPDPRTPLRAQVGPPALQYKIDLAVPPPTAPVGVPNGVLLDAWIANSTLLGRYRLTVDEVQPVIQSSPQTGPLHGGPQTAEAPPKPCEAHAAQWSGLFGVKPGGTG